MTVGQRIFRILEEKHMTQKEFSEKTGIATTTISDWRKKNTNPSSDRIIAICAALEISPEELLSGITEEGSRSKGFEYTVIPKGTEEGFLVEKFGEMDFEDRKRLLKYVEEMTKKK